MPHQCISGCRFYTGSNLTTTDRSCIAKIFLNSHPITLINSCIHSWGGVIFNWEFACTMFFEILKPILGITERMMIIKSKQVISTTSNNAQNFASSQNSVPEIKEFCNFFLPIQTELFLLWNVIQLPRLLIVHGIILPALCVLYSEIFVCEYICHIKESLWKCCLELNVAYRGPAVIWKECHRIRVS